MVAFIGLTKNVLKISCANTSQKFLPVYLRMNVQSIQ